MVNPFGKGIAIAGETGVGKTELVRRLAREADVSDPRIQVDFVVSNGSQSETKQIQTANMEFGGKKIQVSDFQGFGDTGGFNNDQKHFDEQAKVMTQGQKNLNAFGLAYNSCVDRFSRVNTDFIRQVNHMIGSSDNWNHVFLIFTRAFTNIPLDKDQKVAGWNTEIKNILKQAGIERRDDFPVFFVDSKDDNDISTQNEIKRLVEWVWTLPPMETDAIAKPDARFMRITEEKRERQAAISTTSTPRMGTKHSGLFGMSRKTYHAGNYYTEIKTMVEETRKIKVMWDGVTTTHSPWTATRHWNLTRRWNN